MMAFLHTAAFLERAVALGAAPQDIADANSMLMPLLTKPGGPAHAEHCVRVALLASQIATHEGLDARALFFAGLLHDIGKALVPACTLCATERWTEEDRNNMEPHVVDGFRMLRDRFDFTARVILWHHRFQARGYPAELPATTVGFSEETMELVREYGKILMVADVRDAMGRVNSATGGRALSPEEIKTRMLALEPALLGDLVHRLYAAGVLR